MKKLGIIAVAGLLALTLVGCGDPCKENFLTGIGDSIATMGKKGLEKDQVLAERKAARAAECAKKTAGDMKKSLGF